MKKLQFLLAMLQAATFGHAATFTVTNTADTGAGSLRQALTSANSTAGADTIAFSSAFSSASTITLLSALPVVNGDTAINGPGSNLLTLNGNAQVQILQIAANQRVVISKIKFTNGGGRAITNAGLLIVSDCVFEGNVAKSGGAISNTGGLTVVNSQFSSNGKSAYFGVGEAGLGGAIYNSSGSLTVADCTFTGNTATGANATSGPVGPTPVGSGFGGAIYTQGGDVIIRMSQFSFNRAAGGKGGSYWNGGGRPGGDGWGGAVYQGSGSILIEDCSFDGNRAQGGDGGFADYPPGTHQGGNGGNGNGGAIAAVGLQIRRSTINSNTAQGGAGGSSPFGPYGSGGGGFGGGFAGTGDFTNCTVSYNGAGGVSGSGSMVNCTITGNSSGGVSGGLTLRNNLIAGNTPSDASGVSSLGHNLFGSSIGIAELVPSDLHDVPASLGPFGFNGGPTPTHAILLNSPALNAGDNVAAPVTDQRGEARPQDGIVDIGAFEVSTFAIIVDGMPVLPGAYARASAATVSFQTTFPTGSIRYTLDGSTPTLASTEYTGPFSVIAGTIRAAAYDAGLANPVFAGPVILSIGSTRTLTVNTAGLGAVARSPSSAAYPDGAVVTLTAIPVSGGTFQGWSGDITGSTSPMTVTMNGNKTVNATFAIPSPNDTDGDGLRDSWELLYWPTVSGHGPNDDTDGDGYTNLQELAFGLNPLVPDGGSGPKPVVENGYLTITLSKRSGVTYEVQTAGTLFPSQPESFSPATTTVLWNNLISLKVRDNFFVGTQPARFMRVKVFAAP